MQATLAANFSAMAHIYQNSCAEPTSCMLQPSDLVDLDLEDLFQHCKARLSVSQQSKARSNVGLQDSADFASNLLITAASKGHKFSQYYVGRCYDTGTDACVCSA